MSYILHKNDTPVFAYKPQLPQNMPRLPAFFSQPRNRQSTDPERLELPSLDEKWVNTMDTHSSSDGDVVLISRARRVGMKLLSTNPFVPLTLRTTVFIFSAVGLGLAARIFVLTERQGPEFQQQPSVLMALVVLSVAMVYLGYSTYSEFFGQPLGLRSAPSKMTFIMVDLIFIIFASSNLSLAFNTLYDRSWVCQVESNTPTVCARQCSLVGVLFVALVFWFATFGVSIFRMIDRAAS